MTMIVQPLTEGNYFHIYNRGVNNENIFKEPRNYLFFLKQYEMYCSDVFETLAYALLKNHFHLVVYVKENVEVPRRSGEGVFRLNASRQLSHFFNSYAQAVNKAAHRTGPLFESPFERRLVENDAYLRSVIVYCNQNPQQHGFTADFRDWEYTSWQALQQGNNTLVAAQKVTDLFGGMEKFEEAHKSRIEKVDDFVRLAAAG